MPEGMAFRQIIGHRTLLDLTARALVRDSLPPSLLFVGPEGVGKRLVAQSIAQAMNCLSPRIGSGSDTVAIDGCGTCSVCNRIDRGGFPDFIVVKPTETGSRNIESETGSIKIDQLRPVLDQAGYRPFEARRRVVVIDQAERMAAPAQSAFLKNLEEPPTSTQFILVTSRPDMLLVTVRSRCPQLRFGFLTVDEIVDVLRRNKGLEERVSRAAAATSGGSIGQAIKIATGEFSTSRDAALEFLDAVSSARDVRGKVTCAKAFVTVKGKRRTPAADRQELRSRLESMSALLRDIEAITTDSGIPLANADISQKIRKLAVKFGGGRSRRGFSIVHQAIASVDQNGSSKVVADWVASRL
ncbi:MAG: ATP-binding protein [Vicinamibacterales bacterium]